MKIAKESRNSIYAKLGLATDYEEGYETSGLVNGQVVHEKDGNTFYTAALLKYSAKVIKVDDKLEWQIIEISRL